jgi:hypothetical protein
VEATAVFGHLVWPSAFEVFGAWAFVVVVGTLLVQVPVLKFALGVRWDDVFGAVFLAHAGVLLALVIVGVPFTASFAEGTSIEVAGDAWWSPWWARLRWLAVGLPALLIPAGRESLAWPGSGTLPLTVSAGVTVLVQLLVVRSVCDLRWNLRHTATILAVALVTSGALLLLVRWPFGAAEDTDPPAEG